MLHGHACRRSSVAPLKGASARPGGDGGAARPTRPNQTSPVQVVHVPSIAEPPQPTHGPRPQLGTCAGWASLQAPLATPNPPKAQKALQRRSSGALRRPPNSVAALLRWWDAGTPRALARWDIPAASNPWMPTHLHLCLLASLQSVHAASVQLRHGARTGRCAVVPTCRAVQTTGRHGGATGPHLAAKQEHLPAPVLEATHASAALGGTCHLLCMCRNRVLPNSPTGKVPPLPMHPFHFTCLGLQQSTAPSVEHTPRTQALRPSH